jgi:hypothetical protein
VEPASDARAGRLRTRSSSRVARSRNTRRANRVQSLIAVNHGLCIVSRTRGWHTLQHDSANDMKNRKGGQHDSYRGRCVPRHRGCRSPYARVFDVGRHPASFLCNFSLTRLSCRRHSSGASTGSDGLRALPEAAGIRAGPRADARRRSCGLTSYRALPKFRKRLQPPSGGRSSSNDLCAVAPFGICGNKMPHGNGSLRDVFSHDDKVQGEALKHFAWILETTKLSR